MPQDLRYQDIRIQVESTAGNELDVAPFLSGDGTVEIARSEPSPDMPCVVGTKFFLRKAYTDSRTTESFDKKVNPRFKPGQKVSIQIYWDGMWRDPPFGATTYLKFAFFKNTGTHEELEIETQGKLAQVIEIDKAFDPERRYDAQGNEVPVTRDVLGTTRTLADIINSYLHVKAVGPVVNAAGFMTQTTNAYKEYLADSSDSEINFAQQLVWYNPDREGELNFLYENQAGETAIASIPLTLSVVTAAQRLLEGHWEPYTTDLLTYEPERNVEQLAEFIEVQGVVSSAQERPSTVVTGGYPVGMQGFSINVPIEPIVDTLAVTNINWAGLTITTDAKTHSTPKALEKEGTGSVAVGIQLVQQDITTKYFDARRRKVRETIQRYVPEILKLDGGSNISIGAPAWQQETLWNLSNEDTVLNTISHQTAADALNGGNKPDLKQHITAAQSVSNLGGGAFALTQHTVSNPQIAQGAIPYFGQSVFGLDERAQPEQCEYMPEQFYLKTTPVRRRVQITWSETLTGRTFFIDVGNALLMGQHFDELAQSLARLHTARHEQHNCSFPLSTDLFANWQVPGRVISVTEKGKKHHYFTGADALKINRDSVVCETTLFWIGTTDAATGILDPGPTPVMQTHYLLAETDERLIDENGDRLIWN